MQKLFPVLFIVSGAVAIWASITEQSWFVSGFGSQFFEDLFGHNGAKIFYIILGVFVILCGLLALFKM